MFKIALQDPYQDGMITVSALDSVQQKTTVQVGVKGFTVSSSYKLAHNDSVHEFSEKTPVGKRFVMISPWKIMGVLIKLLFLH